jgi:hypothetical protein
MYLLEQGQATLETLQHDILGRPYLSLAWIEEQ